MPQKGHSGCPGQAARELAPHDRHTRQTGGQARCTPTPATHLCISLRERSLSCVPSAHPAQPGYSCFSGPQVAGAGVRVLVPAAGPASKWRSSAFATQLTRASYMDGMGWSISHARLCSSAIESVLLTPCPPPKKPPSVSLFRARPMMAGPTTMRRRRPASAARSRWWLWVARSSSARHA